MNLTDKEFARMFAKTLRSSQMPKQMVSFEADETEEGTVFVFILNRKSGGAKAYFLSLHPHKGYILPHLQSVIWPKLKGWVDYSSVVYQNCLYIMGGRERDTGRFTSKMMKYDPSRDKWIQLSGMRRSKVSFSLNIMDKHIVITGGEASDGEILDTIESYEPLIDAWTLEGKLPQPRKNHSTAVVNNRLFICGGQGPNAAFNHNLWELRRDHKFVGEKETYVHQWYNEWDQVHSRKIQQNSIFEADGRLFGAGGMVQGATEDGVKLSDEQDIDEANSDTEAEEEKKRKKMTEPYVPTYIRMLAETSNRRKKGPKTVTRTTRKLMSIDVTNNYLRHKNPYRAMRDEKRMMQARAGAATIKIGSRVYLMGGYRLEDEQLFVPRVEYYHIKRQRWYKAFDLSTFDDESFRDIQVHLLEIPTMNHNYRVLTTAYKYPLW